ncbi:MULTISPECIES: hypothetical protein [Bacteria]|uniref:Uncharacterized protein n=2 Tax=Bacteria TaxID=2 RepID=A0A1I4UJ87_9BURK|nr:MULTISPECIES: hypothetical protein [Bacteria]SFE69050.1 hypothetical protein SAMN05216506_113164 [Saccharopolyspora kobensis]SFM89054.1 hypothetical protein SAMN02982985_05683 [Rugamonas rubra]
MNDPREPLDNLMTDEAWSAVERAAYGPGTFGDCMRRAVQAAAPFITAAAVRPVLDLTPPPMHPGDDPELHAILTDGWTTCMETVRRTIADKLGGAR